MPTTGFSLRRIAIPAFGPSLLFGLGEGAIFRVIPLTAMAIGFGNGIGSGMMMTLGADHAPRHGRAHFLGVWRLMADIGASCGPALLSQLAATLTLGAGIAANGLLAFVAAGHLYYWIPRVRKRDAAR